MRGGTRRRLLWTRSGRGRIELVRTRLLAFIVGPVAGPGASQPDGTGGATATTAWGLRAAFCSWLASSGPRRSKRSSTSTCGRSPCARTALALLLLVALPLVARAADPLPSWNEGATKRAILTFVEETTEEGSPRFIPPDQRIATFDNDGTLWAEQPMYFQLAFALDRVKALAPQHPEWKEKEPFRSLLAGQIEQALSGGEHAMVEIVMATHAGTTTAEFKKIVEDWLATARHPRFDRPYTDLVYQPMLELLAYLRAKGFKTFIVSGGGIEFMRPWTERVYGIPPEQVVGSSIVTKFELRAGKPVLVREPKVEFVDDGPGKPVGIHRFIGRRPVLAFGNSDGDQQMLEWTAAGDGPRFLALVHHTDAEREWAYDRNSKVGRLDKALDEATAKHWTVVDMKNDWRKIFPFQ